MPTNVCAQGSREPIREFGANIASRRSVAWDGVRVEVLSRRLDTAAEFKTCLPQHALLFCSDSHLRYGRALLDGRGVKRIAVGSDRATVLPAGEQLSGTLNPGGYYNYTLLTLASASLAAIAPNLNPSGIDLTPVLELKDEELLTIARLMRQECLSPGPFGRVLQESLAVSLSALLLRRYSPARPKAPCNSKLTPRQIRRILDHIDDHIACDLRLSELAGLIGMSASYFCASFRETTGLPPHRFILHRRVERAKDLLANSHTPILEVALALGFPNQAHFTSIFRRLTGRTPGQWRSEG